MQASNGLNHRNSTYFYIVLLRTMFARRVGDPASTAGRRMLVARSPLTHVAQIRRPLLVGHGANDPRVKRQEAEQLVRRPQPRGRSLLAHRVGDEVRAGRAAVDVSIDRIGSRGSVGARSTAGRVAP